MDSSFLLGTLVGLLSDKDGANELDDDTQRDDDAGGCRSTEEEQADRDDSTDCCKYVNRPHAFSMAKGLGQLQALIQTLVAC